MKVLVATDGSESAGLAVDYLMEFPLPAGSELTVMTVVTPVLRKSEIDALSEEQRIAYEETRQATKQEASELLEKEAARLGKAGWHCTTLLRSGKPEEEIVDVAEEMEVDSIVVGSHGISGIKRLLLGSVSERLLHYAPCSVLIVRRPEYEGTAAETEPEDRRWIVAFDDSESARHAVEVIASLPLPATVNVNLLGILPLVTMFRQDVRQKLSWFWQSTKAAAEAGLDWASKDVLWSTPHVSSELKEAGNVSEAILETASDQRADLVVLGDKGKGAVERFLLGSVTSQVAHRAASSVWVLRKSPWS